MGLLPDFILDYVTDTTFWTIILIVHRLTGAERSTAGGTPLLDVLIVDR